MKSGDQEIEKTATEWGLTTPGAIAGWGDGASLTVFPQEGHLSTLCNHFEEIVETGKSLVVPMKLLVGALQETMGGEEFAFRFGRKGHVNR